MPCAGCQRRREKIAAAYHAVKTGIQTVKRTYKQQTSPAKVFDRTAGNTGEVDPYIEGLVRDIRE